MSQSQTANVIAQMKHKGATIAPFHHDVFKACETAHNAISKAEGTVQQKLAALLKSKYGDTAPTYLQFRDDRAALKSIATDKGLVDDQWVRKPFNLAVKALYGELPKSVKAAALAKAASRAKAPKAGAVKGETAPRRTGTPETIEQYVARVGVFKVLEVCARILESDESTKEQGATIHTLAKAA